MAAFVLKRFRNAFSSGCRTLGYQRLKLSAISKGEIGRRVGNCGRCHAWLQESLAWARQSARVWAKASYKAKVTGCRLVISNENISNLPCFGGNLKGYRNKILPIQARPLWHGTSSSSFSQECEIRIMSGPWVNEKNRDRPKKYPEICFNLRVSMSCRELAYPLIWMRCWGLSQRWNANHLAQLCFPIVCCDKTSTASAEWVVWNLKYAWCSVCCELCLSVKLPTQVFNEKISRITGIQYYDVEWKQCYRASHSHCIYILCVKVNNLPESKLVAETLIERTNRRQGDRMEASQVMRIE